MTRGRWWLWAALALLTANGLVGAGCHLALGLETAETIDGQNRCSSADECDDGNPCTTDECATVCVYSPIDGVDLPREDQVDGDCQRARCSNGLVEQFTDDTDLPDDNKQCTTDTCASGTPTHTPLAGGSACDQDMGVVCNADGDCVECHSNDDCVPPNTCGGGGTANECGCTPTQSCVVEGLTCGFILDQTCGGTIMCNNGVRDGDETDIDCGGSVDSCSVRCQNGQGCLVNSDCASNVCNMIQMMCVTL